MALIDFSLRELGLVADLLRTGAIREVARRQGLEAGNLSRLLRRLEADSGLTLAVRSQAGLAPTEAGHRLLAQITRLLEHAWHMDEAEASDLERGPLIGIGAVSFLNTHVLAGAVASSLLHLKAQPRVRLLDVQPDDLLAASLRGACDVCFHISALDWPKSWETTPVGELAWRLYTRPGAGRPEDLPYIYPVYWSRDGLVYGNDMHPVALSRRRLGIGVSSAEAAVRVILDARGRFVGFLPEIVARRHVAAGQLVAVDGEDGQVVKRTLFASVHADRVPAKLFAALINSVRSELPG